MLCLWEKYFISNNSKSGKIIFVIVTVFLLAMATYDAELLFVKSWNKEYLAYKKRDILLKLDSLPVTSHSIDANCIFMHPAQPAKNTLIGWGCFLQVRQPCLNKVKQNTMHLK
jgi:hypothetical protein